MKTYKIPVTWSVSTVMEVQAGSLAEAIEMADSLPLSPCPDYIDDSFEVQREHIPVFNRLSAAEKLLCQE